MACAVLSGVPTFPAQNPQAAPLFRFRSGVWINLHHFLYVLGRARAGTPDSQRQAVVAGPREIEAAVALSDAERQAWDAAVARYASGWSTRDVLFDPALVQVGLALAGASDAPLLKGVALEAELASTLEGVAHIYRRVWWPGHARSNATFVDAVTPQIARYGDAVAQRITQAYGLPWPTTGVLVDVSAYANWAGAYSTAGGLIVFSSTALDNAGYAALESLFHEAMHQWDEPVEDRLERVAAKSRTEAPRDLSHALIFYIAGDAVQQEIPGYRPYADANGIWNRSLGRFRSVLDDHWRPYLRGQGTFDDAVAATLRALASAKR